MWIQKVNAASREHGFRYSRMTFALTRSNIGLNRKILGELAENEPYSFKTVLDEAVLQTRIKEEMRPKTQLDYYQAIANNHLVYGEVQPIDASEFRNHFKEMEFDLDTLPAEVAENIMYDPDYEGDVASVKNIFKEHY